MKAAIVMGVPLLLLDGLFHGKFEHQMDDLDVPPFEETSMCLFSCGLQPNL
jgi:hypothetical protein